QGSGGISLRRYGPSHWFKFEGLVRSASSPCSVVGNRPVLSLYWVRACSKLLIWTRAATALALSPCLNMPGATSVASSAMLLTTTSISISVTPDLLFLFV